MANVNFEWDADEAIERWEKIEAEEAENKRRKTILNSRNELPYSESLAQETCECLSCGELLIVICNDEHLPTTCRFTQCLREHDNLNQLYKDSLNDRLNIFEEQVIQIADDAAHDFKEVVRNGRTVKVLDGEAIARAKLRIEVRFRHLKAGRPNKWSDSTTLITKSEDSLGASNISDEELEKRLADMEVKDRIMRAA
jgi:hypothetical protein